MVVAPLGTRTHQESLYCTSTGCTASSIWGITDQLQILDHFISELHWAEKTGCFLAAWNYRNLYLLSSYLRLKTNLCFVAEGGRFTPKENSVPGVEPSNRVYSQIPFSLFYVQRVKFSAGLRNILILYKMKMRLTKYTDINWSTQHISLAWTSFMKMLNFSMETNHKRGS